YAGSRVTRPDDQVPSAGGYPAQREATHGGGLKRSRVAGSGGLSTEAGGTSTVAGFGPADDGRRAGFYVHLCVDSVYVVLDRLLGEHKLCGDFAVGVPSRDERHDFDLARRKTKRVSRSGCRSGPHSTSDQYAVMRCDAWYRTWPRAAQGQMPSIVQRCTPDTQRR